MGRIKPLLDKPKDEEPKFYDLWASSEQVGWNAHFILILWTMWKCAIKQVVSALALLVCVWKAPLPFGRICFVVLVMRKGGESSWSGPWHVGCTSEVCHVHSYQDQFIQPGWAECVFIFSLGLYFVCLYCFNLFVCPHPFVFPWAVESSLLQVFGAGVTNLNEPPRAFATSNIAWVRS